MKAITKVKRFNAYYKEENKNSHMIGTQGETYIEIRFDIIAEDEEEARAMIEEEGEDPDDFVIEETGGVKDQMGNYFKKEIRDARL